MNSVWRQFISIENFKDLKILFILEFLILGMLILLCQTPEYQRFIISHELRIFNPFALLITFLTYSLSTLMDPQRYFNLATIISIGSFLYGCFWVMWELFSSI